MAASRSAEGEAKVSANKPLEAAVLIRGGNYCGRAVRLCGLDRTAMTARAQALRENARGVLDDKTRRELLRQADECEAIAAALAGKLPRDKVRK